jgi:hypothetical protein
VCVFHLDNFQKILNTFYIKNGRKNSQNINDDMLISVSDTLLIEDLNFFSELANCWYQLKDYCDLFYPIIDSSMANWRGQLKDDLTLYSPKLDSSMVVCRHHHFTDAHLSPVCGSQECQKMYPKCPHNRLSSFNTCFWYQNTYDTSKVCHWLKQFISVTSLIVLSKRVDEGIWHR